MSPVLANPDSDRSFTEITGEWKGIVRGKIGTILENHCGETLRNYDGDVEQSLILNEDGTVQIKNIKRGRWLHNNTFMESCGVQYGDMEMEEFIIKEGTWSYNRDRKTLVLNVTPSNEIWCGTGMTDEEYQCYLDNRKDDIYQFKITYLLGDKLNLELEGFNKGDWHNEFYGYHFKLAQ